MIILQRSNWKVTVFKGFYNTDFEYFNKNKSLEMECFLKIHCGF